MHSISCTAALSMWVVHGYKSSTVSRWGSHIIIIAMVDALHDVSHPVQLHLDQFPSCLGSNKMWKSKTVASDLWCSHLHRPTHQLPTPVAVTSSIPCIVFWPECLDCACHGVSASVTSVCCCPSFVLMESSNCCLISTGMMVPNYWTNNLYVPVTAFMAFTHLQHLPNTWRHRCSTCKGLTVRYITCY